MKHLILLATAAVMTCFSSFAFSGKGGGTEKDPYQITNADEFFEIRNELDAHYKLMNDIDLAEFIKEDNPTQGWSPIGNATTPFEGSLDGNKKSIKGLYINRPNIDNVGLFGCAANGNIRNLAILNAEIIGNKNVGTLLGLRTIDYHVEANITNIVVQNTNIICLENAGGIVGCIGFSQNGWHIPEVGTLVKGCSVTGQIYTSNKNSGGICGYSYANASTNANNSYDGYRLTLLDNIVDARIISNGSSGGILAYTTNYMDESHGSYYGTDGITIERNIVKGSIYGNDGVCGISGKMEIVPTSNYTGTIVNNVAALDTIQKVSDKEIYKITNLASPNNYSFAGTVVLWNKTPITLEDNDFNGTSYGLKTLKKRTTYEGMGFDFGSQWAIKEGETFPYNIYQSEMPEIKEFISGSRAYISGKANGTGQVFVFVSGNLFESYVVDNEWKVDLGNIPVGTEAKVSVALDGKMPSIQVSAVAESGTTNPTVKAGDANGDGVIDAADVVSIINYIIGKSASSFNSLNADVNGDGQVLVDDAVGAVELIMNAQ